MKKHILSSVFAVIFSIFAISLTGCSDKIMGWSVVLWNIPEQQIQDGDIVPVYIKSNISHVYVAGAADGTKFEVPLWQLTEPVKKGKIQAIQNKYTEYAHNYASVKLDGLPCRAEPVNTSKQVYRLRQGEVIKLLYKGQGQQVTTGKKVLEGDWFRILTEDGTQGWCFSYNLTLFQTDITGNQIGGEELVQEETSDSYIEAILNKTWYPDSFQTMISSGNIDVSKLNAFTNFGIDTENNVVSLHLAGVNKNWTYEGYTKTDDKEYKLKNIPIILIYKKPGFIVIRYTGESGKPEDFNLVTISEDINEIVINEKTRRTRAYSTLLKAGNKLTSTNYGTLTLQDDQNFTWTNYKLLVSSEIIGATAKGYGTCSVKYAVGKNLSSNYDGVLTFNFEGMKNEVNFLYKIEADGIRFEDASSAKFNGILITERGKSPLVLYFKTR